MWTETPIPMYFKIYLFNWTNADTSLRGPDKPIFQELGPYTFLEHHSKKNITWNTNNNTITYVNQKRWQFIPEMSNGSLDDKITNLNVIAMTIGYMCNNINIFEKMGADLLLSKTKENLVKTDTAGNLLFNGSFDLLLKILNKFRPFIKTLPDMDKFGWFYKRNMSLTSNELYTMHTGQTDINRLGLLTAWNYRNRTVYSGECGRVQGTYGEEFPTNTVDKSQLTLFVNDLCSVLNLRRDKASSMYGIPSQIFVGGEDVFSNKTTCYCTTNTSCPASGARDLSRCNNSPAMASWPHFYQADPSYRAAVVGMNPDPDKHQFYMNIAEAVSIPLEVRARMQLNIHMQSIPDMKYFKNVQNIVMPMLWFSQEANLSSDMASQISVLVKLVGWGRWVLLSLGATGAVMVALGVVLQARGHLGASDERLLQ